MNTDVLFESYKAAAEACKLLKAKGLLNNMRYLISPKRPEGLDIKAFMLLFPYCMRGVDEEYLSALIEKEKPERILIRNIEELGFLRDLSFSGDIFADAHLYSMNSKSVKVLKSFGVRGLTCPYELDIHELKERGLDDSALVIYGRTPLMVSAQCVNKTVSGECVKKNGKGADKTQENSGFYTAIRDRKKVLFPVRAECRYCYNVVYNSVPLSLFRELDEIERLKPDSLRLDFTTESPEEAADIIEAFINKDLQRLNTLVTEYTKGHFRKGVE